MNAKYSGRKINRNEFGDVVSIFSPCVTVTMKENEKAKFNKMMEWISINYFEYEYDMLQDEDIVTAYIYVDDGADGAEFLSLYKEAKKMI